jgi:predicted TIM-barrel fold metal-dependent hydrolase
MGVTDCHVHINPLWDMRPEARERLELAPGLESMLRRPSELVDYLDRSGVERAILINYVAPEIIGYTETANDFVAEYVRACPERLLPVGGIGAFHSQPGRRIRELVEDRGIRGIKIHPPHQLLSPRAYIDGTWPGLREVYETLERFETPVIFHTGTSVFPGARNRFGEPLLIEDVAIDFPRLPIVLAHGGRPLWMNQAVFLARRFPNVWLELSGVPPSRLLEYFPELPRIAGKAIFGSDWPGPGVRDIGANLQAFRALPLAAELKTQILETNPLRLFPRRPPN